MDTQTNTKGNKMYSEGDTITYTAFSGEFRTGVVVEKSDDIKNGRAGFDLMLKDGGRVWGYDSQIVKVFFGKGA